MPRSHRPPTLAILAIWKGLSQKEIAGGRDSRRSRSRITSRKRSSTIPSTRASSRESARGPRRSTSYRLPENLEALSQDQEIPPRSATRSRRGSWRARESCGRRSPRPSGARALSRQGWLSPARRPRSGPLAGPREWSRLEPLSEGQRLAVARAAPEFQTWALVERICEESEAKASREAELAASLARLAQEIAERVQGPEEWRNRVQGFAAAHAANALRVTGELKAADSVFEEAKRRWLSGRTLTIFWTQDGYSIWKRRRPRPNVD